MIFQKRRVCKEFGHSLEVLAIIIGVPMITNNWPPQQTNDLTFHHEDKLLSKEKLFLSDLQLNPIVKA